jgi:hypothetical protein
VDRHVEPGFFEVAELLRHVDPGVVGIRVEVEREAERFGLRGHVLALLAAGGEAQGEGEQGDGDGEGRASGELHPLLSIAK